MSSQIVYAPLEDATPIDQVVAKILLAKSGGESAFETSTSRICTGYNIEPYVMWLLKHVDSLKRLPSLDEACAAFKVSLQKSAKIDESPIPDPWLHDAKRTFKIILSLANETKDVPNFCKAVRRSWCHRGQLPSHERKRKRPRVKVVVLSALGPLTGNHE